MQNIVRVKNITLEYGYFIPKSNLWSSQWSEYVANRMCKIPRATFWFVLRRLVMSILVIMLHLLNFIKSWIKRQDWGKVLLSHHKKIWLPSIWILKGLEYKWSHLTPISTCLSPSLVHKAKKTKYDKCTQVYIWRKLFFEAREQPIPLLKCVLFSLCLFLVCYCGPRIRSSSPTWLTFMAVSWAICSPRTCSISFLTQGSGPKSNLP